MINYIKGKIRHIYKDAFLVITNDIGYKVYATIRLLEKFEKDSVQEFFIYQHIKEDANVLFGFENISDIEIFELLIGVNGVGPKSALGILSGITIDELYDAIMHEDASHFTKVSGIGKKTASRIILELKNKLPAFEITPHLFNQEHATKRETRAELIEALISLGYNKGQIDPVIKLIPPELTDLSEQIRFSLQQMQTL